MDDTKISDPLKIIAGVVLTLIIIGVIFAIVTTFLNKTQKVANQANEEVDNMLETTYTQYDAELITGSTLLNLIKQTEGKSDDIYILVKTNANTAGTYYVCGSNNVRLSDTAERALIKKAKKSTDINYITPKEKFEGTVIRNDNRAIIGLVFEQQ